MSDDYTTNIDAALKSIEGAIQSDLGFTTGINPAFAQTHALVHGAFMSAMASLGRPVTFIDGYLLGITAGIARLLTVDPRQAGAAFEEIAAHAIGGSAHARTALAADAAAQQQAQDAQRAAEAATVAPAAPAAPDAPPTPAAAPDLAAIRKDAFDRAQAQPSSDDVLAKLRAAQNTKPTSAVNKANGNAAASIGATSTDAQNVAPQDPREAAQAAYGDGTDATQA